MNYRRTPEIETADLSQCHAGLNLSQFQTDFYFFILELIRSFFIMYKLNKYGNFK